MPIFNGTFLYALLATMVLTLQNYNQYNLKTNQIEIKEVNSEETEDQTTLEDLLNKKKLTRMDFVTLKSLISYPEDIEYVLNSRNIIYAQKGPGFDEALNLYFGSALGSINHDHPVICDEYSILNAALLLEMDWIEEIYLGRLSNTRETEKGETKKYDHAFVIYKTDGSNWSYISNDSVVEMNFTTKEDTVMFIAEQTGYDSKQIKYKLRKVTSLGEWVYDNEESRKMDPYYDENDY